MTQPQYVSTTITPAARDALRRLAVIVTSAAGVRVSMSDALRVAEIVTAIEPEAVRAAAISLGLIDPPDEHPAPPKGRK